MLDFIAHKLLPPSCAADLMPRSDMLSMLAAERPHRIVLLLAPAGYGKTSVLRQLHAGLAGTGQAAAWLTFDDADSDPARMLLCLRAALREGVPMPDAPYSALNDTRVRHLFLDDLERLGPQSIRLLLSIIAEVLPPTLRVYLCSRSLHQISVANLKARKVLLELDLAQLRFLPAETETYLRHANLFLSEQEIGWLQQATEGWPAAIELLVLAWKRIQGGIAGGLPDLHGIGDLNDYLAEEVFRSQPEQVQAFLAATVPLQSFSIELADAVRERSDSAELVAALRLSGLPIQPLGGQWYRYHPLFAGHIMRHHPAPGRGRAAVYARAAAWLSRHGRELEAFDCYVKAGDAEGAADLLETLADTLRARAQYPSLLHCCDQLPEALLRRRPRLTRSLLVALVYSPRHADTKRWMDYFRQRAAETGSDPAYGASLRAFEPVQAFLDGDIGHSISLAEQHWPAQQHAPAYERGLLATGLAYSQVIRGAQPQAMRMLIEARRICGESGSATNMAVVIFLQAYLDAMQGKLELALQQTTAIDRLVQEHSSTIPPAFPYSYAIGLLLMLLYERNQLDEAASRLSYARGLLNIAPPWDTISAVLLVQAKLMALQSSPAAAKRWLENEIMSARKQRSLHVRNALEGELSRLAVLDGNRAAVEGYAALLPEAALSPWILASQEIDGAGIAQARLAIACGRTDAALAQLDALLRQALAMGRLWRAAKLRVLQALALEGGARLGEALAHMALALEQAAQSGLIRTLLDEGESVQRLLRLLRGDPAAKLSAAAAAHLELLLGCAEDSRQPPAPDYALTRAERDVLALVALGQSNRDVAAGLGISANTVKWHLAHVYDKLGVSNRGQAVHLARQEGLLGAAPHHPK